MLDRLGQARSSSWYAQEVTACMHMIFRPDEQLNTPQGAACWQAGAGQRFSQHARGVNSMHAHALRPIRELNTP